MFLQAWGADDIEAENHADLLERRAIGELTFRRAAQSSGVAPWPFIRLAHLSAAFGYPVYRQKNTPFLKWTLDVARPGDEFGIEGGDEDLYVMLVVDYAAFRPCYLEYLTQARRSRLPGLWERHQKLNDMVVSLHECVAANFSFGTADLHLRKYVLGPLLGVPRLPKLKVEECNWQWSISGRHIDEVGVSMILPTDEHPNRGLRLQRTPSNSILIWTVECCEEDDRLYAQLLNLQSVTGTELKALPLWMSERW